MRRALTGTRIRTMGGPGVCMQVSLILQDMSLAGTHMLHKRERARPLQS